MVHSISRKEAEKAGALLIGSLQEGYACYPALLLRGTKEKMKAFLLQVTEAQQCYADFYYPSFEEKAQKQFLAGLSDQEREYMQCIECTEGKIYYPLDDEICTFLLDITAREWLFSSFYFTEKRAVLWGNYQMTFPLFCEDEEVREYYSRLARACGLQTEMMESQK
nr:hypothetical protein [uncultured Faecalimonas sp.]